jgi:hypothetical protein
MKCCNLLGAVLANLKEAETCFSIVLSNVETAETCLGSIMPNLRATESVQISSV